MEIYKKLFKLRQEVGKLSKTETNPFFKSKYFDVNGLIENVRPLLEKHNLLLLQPIIKNSVVSQIFDIETGDKVESGLELPALTDPQKTGSCITYYRRYTLQSLLGLEAEDDDGNKAASVTPPKPAPAKKGLTPLTDDMFTSSLKILNNKFPQVIKGTNYNSAVDFVIVLQKHYSLTAKQQETINEILNKK